MSEANIWKSYWFWVAVIVVAGIFMFYVGFDLPEPKAELVIYFENDTIKKFEGPVQPDITLVQVLYFSSFNDKFEIRYNIDPDGNVNLASIGSLSNIGIKSWYFYVNGNSVMTKDLDRIKVRAGDLIEAKYE